MPDTIEKPYLHAHEEAAMKKAAKTKKVSPAKAGTAAHIALDKISTLAQVRTEFDPQAFVDLVESMRAHGMLQPILVRPATEAGHYIVIAGERRFRAAQELKWPGINAIVRTAEDEEAATLQLIENIQREELSLADTAAGVLQLYEKHKTLEPIAKIVGKSVPWVSKHLAAARSLNWQVAALLDAGRTEDLDLLLTLNQILGTGADGYSVWHDLVDDDKLPTRAEARKALEQLRKKADEDKAAAKLNRAPSRQAEIEQMTDAQRKEREEADARAAQAKADDNLLSGVIGRVIEGGPGLDIDKLLEVMDQPTQVRIETALAADMADMYRAGQVACESQSLPRAIFKALAIHWALQEDFEAQAAFLLAVHGQPFTMRGWLIEVRELHAK
jgi:ParB/RepB/Spo0J family partition protein